MAVEPFELELTVDSSDIDELGHVNNVTYLRWVQDAAVAHWNAASSPADRARFLWVVLRHEIDYKQPAFAGEKLVARTWVGAAKGLRFERYTDLLRVADRTVLAKALTLWCPICARTGRPTVVSAEVRDAFSVGSTSPQPR